MDDAAATARAGFARTWPTLALAHVLLAWASHAADRSEALPLALRQAVGAIWIVTLYGPMALAEKLGVARDALERKSFLFGDPTPAGWALTVASWAVVWALVAWGWTRLRSRRAR